MVEENSGRICMRCSISAELFQSVGKEHLEGSSVNVPESYGVETLSPMVGSKHIGIPNLAVYAFSRELPLSHHRIFCIISSLFAAVRLLMRI